MELAIQTPFSNAQLELLGLFKTKLNNADIQELRQLLLEFKFRKLQENIEQVIEEKGYTASTFEAMQQEHNRTPYKTYRKHLQYSVI